MINNIKYKNKITGREILQKKIIDMPEKSGVYRMIGDEKNILYIGKAKNLKKRLLSYTRPTGNNNRITRMVSLIKDVEITITETEIDALLLELNLIKEKKPKYNIMLKDDKTFPYIFISSEHDFPRLEKHRGLRTRPGYYFGPFANAGAVNRTLNTLQKVFLLRSCSDREVEAGNRPCLNYHLKRCSGPCGNKISKEDYKELVNDVKNFFGGKSTFIQKKLSTKMQNASKNKEYEIAAQYRDRISALANMSKSDTINPQFLEEADVFAISKINDKSCVQVFFFRSWRNLGNKAFFPIHKDDFSEKDILQSFIPQFYRNKQIPKLILVSHDFNENKLISETFSRKEKKRIKIVEPKKGERLKIIKHALENSKNALQRYQNNLLNNQKNLSLIKKAFDLKETPKRIEIYDNSHIQGSFAVGAMVVATKEGLDKSEYRKFNIKSEKTNDDFAMMNEVVQRRFKRIKQNKSFDNSKYPSVILIDGGRGQYSSTKKALDAIGVNDVTIISIAKGKRRNAGREKFYTDRDKPYLFKPNDPMLFYMQRLRDEAHRFAIGTHKAKRKKEFTKNPLDEIPGIGQKRKKALLNFFGSARAISRARLDELTSVDGISLNMANIIFNWFNE